jgi:flagellar biosynthesis chaperone FliJ
MLHDEIRKKKHQLKKIKIKILIKRMMIKYVKKKNWRRMKLKKKLRIVLNKTNSNKKNMDQIWLMNKLEDVIEKK